MLDSDSACVLTHIKEVWSWSIPNNLVPQLTLQYDFYEFIIQRETESVINNNYMINNQVVLKSFDNSFTWFNITDFMGQYNN